MYSSLRKKSWSSPKPDFFAEKLHCALLRSQTRSQADLSEKRFSLRCTLIASDWKLARSPRQQRYSTCPPQKQRIISVQRQGCQLPSSSSTVFIFFPVMFLCVQTRTLERPKWFSLHSIFGCAESQFRKLVVSFLGRKLHHNFFWTM